MIKRTKITHIPMFPEECGCEGCIIAIGVSDTGESYSHGSSLGLTGSEEQLPV